MTDSRDVIVVVARVADMPQPHVASVKARCDRCGLEVWRSAPERPDWDVSASAMVRAQDRCLLICVVCAVRSGLVDASMG